MSHEFNVERLVCCLSTCIYPDKVPSYPILENWLHLGPPHPSNEGYAFAKRMCEVQCRLYNEQYGTDFICVVPTNLYGPFDNYAESKSHVVAALIKRAFQSQGSLEVWGSGKPLRQFCYAGDLAMLILWTCFGLRDSSVKLIALVPEQEHTIGELAHCVAKAVGLGEVKFDPSKADGQLRKTMSNATLRRLLPSFQFTKLESGIKLTVDAYLQAQSRL